MEFDGPLLQGRWRLGRRLGQGNQGHTFLARDEQQPDRIVAVKRHQLGGNDGWKRFDLFEREVRALRTIKHPAVPRFIDSFEGERGTFYLVMERAPGASLRAIATRARFSEQDLLEILVKTLGVLKYLHELEPPIIHRDIKPANLLRDARGRLSVVDFGGVRDAIRAQGGSTVIGTFGYMAPEQLHGQATAATDIYGLGATIVALAGKVEPEDVPRQGLRMNLRPHLSHLSSGLVEVLEKMTEPDPDLRPQSASAVLRALPDQAPGVLRKKRRPRLTGKAKQANETKPPPTAESAGSPSTAMQATDDPYIIELDPAMPAPVRVFVGAVFGIAGIAGVAGLWAVQRLMVPILYTVASAFVSSRKRTALRESQIKTVRLLDDGRAGFHRLAAYGFGSRPKQLPSGKR